MLSLPGPFCQVSIGPSTLPQGLRDPPAYSSPTSPTPANTVPHDQPPAYQSLPRQPSSTSIPSHPVTRGVVHFVHPEYDTLPSLSLQYGVPIDALRRSNGLFSDHLLAARRTIVIPAEYYHGSSLSPSPIEGEVEEERKSKIRRWMVACKEAELLPDSLLGRLKYLDY